jgi:exopolysaccharide production protein ExoY
VLAVASKTVSEISKLSPSRAAFDLPVHDGGGQLTTSQEPARTRERPKKRALPKPQAERAARPKSPKSKSRSNGHARTTDIGLSMLIEAASAVDGPALSPALQWVRTDDREEPLGGVAKRLLDIIVAGTALVLLSPLLLIVAGLIYATMGRPVLFPQRRLGFQGRPFACYKFRTMVRDAETTLQSHLDNNPDAAREWIARQKLQVDPRVTKLGRLLRRSSIDELPQLFSVLMGRMSCVGPRPIIGDEVARYGRFWADYVKTRPGLTGAWQVSGRNRLSYRRRVAIDVHYVRTWSVWRDLLILLKTIPAVLRTDDTA